MHAGLQFWRLKVLLEIFRYNGPFLTYLPGQNKLIRR